MADKEVLNRVVAVTARVLGLEPDSIEEGSNFIFDLGAEIMTKPFVPLKLVEKVSSILT